MVEYGFTLHTKYSLYLYTKKKKKRNYPTKLPKPKSYLSPYFKRKKEKRKFPLGFRRLDGGEKPI